MCAKLWTVGPQQYIATRPGSRGCNSSSARDRVLNSFKAMRAEFPRAPAAWKVKNGPDAGQRDCPTTDPITNSFARRVETATHRLALLLRSPARTSGRGRKFCPVTLSQV